ncbi:MAG: hypothetical protein WKF88_07800 [Ferruginibacter sp.]
MKLFGNRITPVLVVFISVTVFIVAAGALWRKYNIDRNVMLGANLLFLLINVLIYFLQKRSLRDPNPNAFIRSVIGGMMIKMFTAVIAVLVYVVSVGPGYNKKAVFISLFIYLLYLGAEVAAISKEIRKKNG